MRDCKGIKISLAICPFSHRDEDFLPQPEFFWSLRMSRVSFLPSLFLLAWFPARWATCHFHCAEFSSRSASTMGAFTKVGLLLCLASASRGLSRGCFSSVQFSSVAQSCQTLCDPMDYSLPSSSAHGIFQTRVLEWSVISFSRASSQPRD